MINDNSPSHVLILELFAQELINQHFALWGLWLCGKLNKVGEVTFPNLPHSHIINPGTDECFSVKRDKWHMSEDGKREDEPGFST